MKQLVGGRDNRIFFERKIAPLWRSHRLLPLRQHLAVRLLAPQHAQRGAQLPMAGRRLGERK